MTIDLRKVPKLKPLGTLIPNVRFGSAELSPALKNAVFSTKTDSKVADLIAKAAFGNIARGYEVDADAVVRDYTFNGQEFLDLSNWEQVKADLSRLLPVDLRKGAEEPFIHVKLTVPNYDSPTLTETLHYSDIDRPVGKGEDAIQLDGRVLDLSYCGRRMAPDGGIARMSTTLRLANTDAAVNRLFRDPSFLKAQVDIRVGFRTLPPKWYRRIGPIWRVDRVAAITPTYVELALIDATDTIFGEMLEPPTINALRDVLDIPEPKDAPSDDPHLPVLFGDEWGKAVPLDYQSLYSASPYRVNRLNTRSRFPDPYATTRYCLGVTRNPNACPGTIDVKFIATFQGFLFPFKIGVLSEDETKRQIDLWIDYGADHYIPGSDLLIYSVPVTAPDGRLWYAAILEHTLHLPTAAWQRATGLTDVPYKYLADGAFWPDGVMIDELWNMAVAGRLYVQWPHGAEGYYGATDARYPDEGKHDPASIIEHIVRLYASGGGYSKLHRPSFDKLRKTFGGVKGFGGSYTYGTDAGTVISSICKSLNLDLWWDADGLLRISSQKFSRQELLDAVPGAIVYDASNDMLRDTWQETLPIGAERWGIANRFSHGGLRDWSRAGFIDELGLDEREDLIKRWGRILEVDVDWTWVVSGYVYRDGVPVYTPVFLEPNRTELRSVATFAAPLYALELEVGDFIRVSHPAGSQVSNGYSGRLFRVEEVGLDWGGKRAKVVCVDMNLEEKRRTVLFDDDIGWNRISKTVADGKNWLYLTGGSRTVTLVGPDFSKVSIKVGDLILYDDAFVNINLEVVAVGAGTLTVDEAPPMSVTTGVFKIQRTALDPPTDAEFPGRYRLGASIYACASVDGTFSDGSPGFLFEGH